MFNKNYYTLADLINYMNNASVHNTNEKSVEDFINYLRGYNTNKENVNETPKEEPSKSYCKTNDVGNIYTKESIEQALRENANDVAALQKQIEEANNRSEQLRVKLNQLNNQTKIVRQGNNVAITMTRESLAKLVQEIGNILGNSDAERLTINLSDVG